MPTNTSVQAKNLTTSAALHSGRAAYAEAGFAPADIDLLQLYDCFTPALLIQIEDPDFVTRRRR